MSPSASIAGVSSGRGDARTHDHFLVQGALGLGHHGDEGIVEIGLARFREQLLQRTGGDDLAVVHRHQPVEALRFVHIGGGDNDAHLRPARADRVDEVPELAAREGIDAGGRLVEDEKVRVVDEGAAEAQLLLHAAGQFARGTRFELLQARRGQKLVDLGATLRRRQSEQSAEEIDVLEDGERRVEVAAEALRHIGDATADVPQCLLVGDGLVEDDNLAALNDLHPRDEPQQRGFANAVRPDHADHDARRNVDRDVSERDRRTIAVRYVLDPGDGLAGHFASGVLVSAALLSGVFGAVGSRSGRGLVRRRFGQLHLKLGWPLKIGLGADEAQAPDARLYPRVELLKHLRIDLQLHSEHQLGAFVRGLDRLRGELRVGRDKADFCRNNVVGDGIEDNAGLVADREPARVRRRQEHRHIDIGEVEDRGDRRAGGDNLAGPRKLILNAPQSRRHEGQIIDDRLDAIDLGLRVRDMRQGLIALRGEVFHRRHRGIEIALALFEDLLGDEAGLHQFLAALKVGFGEFERALPGRDFGLRRRKRVVCLLHIGLGGAQLRLVFRRGEFRDSLPLRDARAFLHGHFRETPSVFRRDVHLGRFKASVRLDDAIRQRLAPEAGDQISDWALCMRRGNPRDAAPWRPAHGERARPDAQQKGRYSHAPTKAHLGSPPHAIRT